MATNIKSYDYFFGILLLLTVAFCIPWYQGFLLGDDYLGAAYQLINGNWDVENNYWANRVGSYLPYAIGMKIFNFGLWLNYITTVEYLCLLVMVYVVLGKYKKSIAFIATCLLATSTVMQQNATVVMGDMLATVFSNAVILAYFYFLLFVAKTSKTVRIWGIVIAILFTAAFWVKETVVFYLPLIAWFYWKDRKMPEFKMYWKWFSLIAFLGTLTFFLAYWHETGDALYRIKAMESGPSASDCNYATSGWNILIARLTWQPFRFLMENYTFGCFLLLSVFQILSYDSNNKTESFFKNYFIGTISLWWLGSQSLNSYNPMALVHRLWLPLLVPMAINSALFIEKIVSNKIEIKTALRVVFGAVVLLPLVWLSIYSSMRSFEGLQIEIPNLFSIACWYTIICVSTIAALFTKVILEIIPSVKSLFFLIVIMPFVTGGCLQLISWANKKSKGVKNGFETEQEMVLYALSLKPHKLIADYRVKHFYYAYTMNMGKAEPIEDYNEINTDSIKLGDYLLLNPERQEWFRKNITVTLTYTRAHYDIAGFVNNPEENGFVPIKRNESNVLYRFTGKRE